MDPRDINVPHTAWGTCLVSSQPRPQVGPSAALGYLDQLLRRQVQEIAREISAFSESLQGVFFHLFTPKMAGLTLYKWLTL